MKNNYKQLEESRFLEDLKSTDLLLKTNDPNKNYNFITKRFLEPTEENKGLYKTQRNKCVSLHQKEIEVSNWFLEIN